MASIRKRGNSWNAQIRIKGWQQSTKDNQAQFAEVELFH